MSHTRSFLDISSSEHSIDSLFGSNEELVRCAELCRDEQLVEGIRGELCLGYGVLVCKRYALIRDKKKSQITNLVI